MFFRPQRPQPRSGAWLIVKIFVVLTVVLLLLSMCSASISHMVDHAPRSIALEQS